MNRIVKYTVEQLDTSKHNRESFVTTEPSLEQYLKRTAGQDQKRRVASTYVLCGAGSSEILGYFTISPASIPLDDLPDAQKKKLPRYSVVPAYLIGRLAVHSKEQGKGHGKKLIANALRRCQAASDSAGGAIVLVDALHEQAAKFYLSLGFIPLSDPFKLFFPVAAISR